jgi:arylformamidase
MIDLKFFKFTDPIDISWPISETSTTWKDRFATTFIPEATYEKDAKRSTSIKMHAHTGTHVDAQSHFLRDGKTIDHIPLRDLIGICKVIDFSESTRVNISKQDFMNFDEKIQKDDIILLKTRNSYQFQTDSLWNQNFVFLEESGAEFLKNKGIKAVGIDYTGIERSDIQKNHSTHRTLLDNNIIIIEGLRLGHVTGLSADKISNTETNHGTYYIFCLPINLIGIEASPARAILFPIN